MQTDTEAEGFTLIELVVVIVLLGILTAVAIPKYVDLRDKANESHDLALLDGLKTATTMLYASNIITGASATNEYGAYWPTETSVTNNMTEPVQWLYYSSAAYDPTNGIWTVSP